MVEQPAEGPSRDSVQDGGRQRRKGGSREEAACSAEEKAKEEIEEVKADSGSEEPRFCSSDLEEAKGKRKLGVVDGYLPSLECSEDGEGGNGVLSLRSGKRVSKRGNDGIEGGRQVGEFGKIGEDKGKAILDSKEESREFQIPKISKGKRKISDSGEEEVIADENGDNSKSKGKGLLVEDDGLVSNSNLDNNVEIRLESEVENNSADNVVSNEGQVRNEFMERFRDIARRNAYRFAHFDGEEEDNEPHSEVDDEPDIEDWPGPFSTALKIIRDREKKNQQPGSSSSWEKKPADVVWFPKSNQDCKWSKNVVPSLQELSLRCLANNADKLVSLDYFPDCLKHRLSQLLCDSRRMNAHVFKLMLQGSPTEVCVKDCSWLTEEEFTKCFQNFDPSNLTVLQLGFCGRCLPDFLLCSTLACAENSLPVLTTLSVRGACRLSDIGLKSLVSSAPALRSLNLTECSLLTSSSIDTLANSLGLNLRELYLDQCLSIDVMLTLPALKKLEQLEVLSLAGIATVCDKFIREFISIRGHNMKELILADCVNLTDSSLKIIAEKCPGLRAIDLSNLRKLTDSSLGYLANCCRAIQRLILSRDLFSDKSIAAFLETSGECLEELSLNSVRKVGCHTALSIARRLRVLRSLDLSFCRGLTDNALGFIVDSCLSLRVLKIFGCTQVTSVFVNGHSNPDVKIIGLPMCAVLEDFKEPSV